MKCAECHGLIAGTNNLRVETFSSAAGGIKIYEHKRCPSRTEKNK